MLSQVCLTRLQMARLLLTRLQAYMAFPTLLGMMCTTSGINGQAATVRMVY